MDIRALAEQYAPYIIERRRYYHQHPELSFKEFETTKSLIEDVKAMGLEVQTFPDYTGLIATLDTGRPGKTVMLRSDIDALPVKECTGLPFASENDGVMHACGHDNHMAMLLGAAKVLCDVKDELAGGRHLRPAYLGHARRPLRQCRRRQPHGLHGQLQNPRQGPAVPRLRAPGRA